MFRSLIPGWSKTQEVESISDSSFSLWNRIALGKKKKKEKGTLPQIFKQPWNLQCEGLLNLGQI